VQREITPRSGENRGTSNQAEKPIAGDDYMREELFGGRAAKESTSATGESAEDQAEDIARRCPNHGVEIRRGRRTTCPSSRSVQEGMNGRTTPCFSGYRALRSRISYGGEAGSLGIEGARKREGEWRVKRKEGVGEEGMKR